MACHGERGGGAKGYLPADISPRVSGIQEIFDSELESPYKIIHALKFLADQFEVFSRDWNPGIIGVVSTIVEQDAQTPKQKPIGDSLDSCFQSYSGWQNLKGDARNALIYSVIGGHDDPFAYDGVIRRMQDILGCPLRTKELKVIQCLMGRSDLKITQVLDAKP